MQLLMWRNLQRTCEEWSSLMAVHVDEIVSSVIPEPEEQHASAPAAQEPAWKTAAQMRSLHARIVQDRARTAAEGFDD